MVIQSKQTFNWKSIVLTSDREYTIAKAIHRCRSLPFLSSVHSTDCERSRWQHFGFSSRAKARDHRHSRQEQRPPTPSSHLAYNSRD